MGMIPIVSLPPTNNPRERLGAAKQKPKRQLDIPSTKPVARAPRSEVDSQAERIASPDVRAIFKENAQLRADNAILINKLRQYESRFGVI